MILLHELPGPRRRRAADNDTSVGTSSTSASSLSSSSDTSKLSQSPSSSYPSPWCSSSLPIKLIRFLFYSIILLVLFIISFIFFIFIPIRCLHKSEMGAVKSIWCKGDKEMIPISPYAATKGNSRS